MVMLAIDDETYAALSRQAAAHGQSVAEWLRLQGSADKATPTNEPPFGVQMAKLFSEVGLTDEESIPELKGQAVRSAEFD